MVVAVTLVDAQGSPAAAAFAKMLVASLNLRNMENVLISNITKQSMLDVSTSEANGTEFAKSLGSSEALLHIDVRSSIAMEHYDFVVMHLDSVAQPYIAQTVQMSLSLFSEAIVQRATPTNMYPSVYAGVVLDIPTICIYVNEGSADLYRAAADEVAEVTENLLS